MVVRYRSDMESSPQFEIRLCCLRPQAAARVGLAGQWVKDSEEARGRLRAVVDSIHAANPKDIHWIEARQVECPPRS